jgi:hypothetical protein
LSAGDPRLPIVRGPTAAHGRARGGHGRREPTLLGRCGDGHQLGRWVRLVLSDHEPRWQVTEGGAAA